MNQIYNYIEYGVLVLILIFFLILVFRYFYYWDKLKNAFIQTGKAWPFYSQEELSEKAFKEIGVKYGMMARNIGKTLQVILFTQTDNPLIQKPLHAIRTVFVVFLFFPFLAVFLLGILFAFLEV